MEYEGVLPCSQELSIGLYLELDESTPYHLIMFLQVQFLHYCSIYV
jgi:hypothetical protein